jgi:hypothetical protein
MGNLKAILILETAADRVSKSGALNEPGFKMSYEDWKQRQDRR